MEDRERGFSLVELIIAMTVTLIITGAVFQLMSAGQTAFRREPAMADRQLNIRMAMDLIGQDLYQAGYGMPAFAQAFTDDLDGAGDGEGNPILGSGGEQTDVLEIFRASDCPPLSVCPLNSDPSKSIQTLELFSSCYTLPAIVLMGNDTEWDLRWAKTPGKGQSAKKCADSDTAGSRHGHAVFPPGQSPLNPTDSFTSWDNPPTYMMVGMAIRYRINIGPDNVPNLERSAFGGQDDLGGNSTWQIIARGIEDLQVQYENATGWQEEPGSIDCGAATGCTSPAQADYDRLVRRVRVRLSARVTESGRFAGESTSAVGTAVRGQLSTEIAPRAAATTLQMRDGTL